MNKTNMFILWSILYMISSMLFLTLSMKMMYMKTSMMIEWEILKINSSNIFFLILMDWMSMMFMSTVTMISSMIMMYSGNYMNNNKNESNRFIMLINLFILSMMLMIISPNMISIMLGWDGLGLVSYCLVIFYSSKKMYNSGMITCLTNRMGDIGLLMAISWMMSYGSWHFMFYKEMYMETLCYLIVISCFTKSAQMPFYSWLPEAMAAPTPISALVHSSTLVTAGVYLTIRFMGKMNTKYFMLTSMLTTIMSSICANYEFDLKKIIALSTLSQLGMMMSSIFLGMKELAFLHLLTHATFKSLLFMSAGIFIFYNMNNQDIRNLSMNCKNLPMTSTCFSISTMALCGMPFMSGFYSKDIILENMSINMINMTSYNLMYLSLMLTLTYSMRMIYYLMMKNKKTNLSTKIMKFNLMKISMILLTIMSINFGSMLMWMLNLNLKLLMITKTMSILTLLLMTSGIWMSLESMKFNKYLFYNKMYEFNSNMWNTLKMMKKYQKMLFMFSLYNKKQLNLGWGEYLGAMGLSNQLMKMSKMMLMSKNNIFMLSILSWMFMMM
uniref:NADH-ubiquinone oxidoreductase chain 5 n=1 Tax=Destinoides conspicuus TaxID=3137869 RepID=A0AAU6PBX5_9HEMI